MSQVPGDNPSPASGQVKMEDAESDFNLKVVLVSFKQCLNEKEEVLLEHYLTGWRGLVRCVGASARWGFPGLGPGAGPSVCLPSPPGS